MGLLAVLFRVGCVVFVVFWRWCAVKESKVLSVKRSTFSESPGASGAFDIHAVGFDLQWTSPAGALFVAADYDMDVNLRWVGI